MARPRDWTPERHHQTKQGIPTMGGLILVWVWVLTVMSPYAPEPWYFTSLALLIVLGMGFLGVYDDWSKITRRGGIGARAKFVAQNLCAFAPSALWYWADPVSAGYLWIPLFNAYLFVGPLIVLWATLVIVSASNAVNLTDGLDGLAATVLSLCFGALALCAGMLGQLDVVFSATVAAGACLGFLCLNWHPARLFMGDTGALAFGALLGFYAVQLNITLLLPLIAIVPVLETVSVMLQVVWFKRYKTRIFKMAPIHHHFELIGYSEHAISAVAGIITLVGSLIAVALIFFNN